MSNPSNGPKANEKSNSIDEYFDRKFVFAVCILGLFYTTIVTVLVYFLNNAIAGIIAATLTTLFVGILQRFETLRFKKLDGDQEKIIHLPRLSFHYIIFSSLAFLSIQLIFGLILGLIIKLSGLVEITDTTTLQEVNNIFSMKIFTLLIVFSTCLGYILVGYLSGRILSTGEYGQTLIAALLSLFFLILIDLVTHSGSITLNQFSILSIYSLLYVISAFLGLKAAYDKNKKNHGKL